MLSEWENAYQKMKGKPLEITDVNQNKFLFLIDEGYEILDYDGTLTNFQNDRVVVFYGFSRFDYNKQERRNKRI